MRSFFASQVTDTIAIDGHSIAIRKLNPRQLHQAAIGQQRQGLEDLEALGGFKKIQAVLDGMTPAERKAASDPLQQYDRAILIDRGVTAWTFDLEKTPDTIADLDDDVQDAIARAVLKLSKPSLFQTADEQETERKNA